MPKPKLCKVCRDPMPTNARPLQSVCSLECAQVIGALKTARDDKAHAKQKRAELKAAKLAIKPMSYWMQRAQTAINKYCRLRDLKAGYGCIDCGKPFEPQKIGGSVDAGHYLSRGSHPNLRFDERNIHAQRKNCNRPGGTTAAAFRLGMIARIGLEAVEELESDTQARHYKIPDLQEIEQKYLKLIKELTSN